MEEEEKWRRTKKKKGEIEEWKFHAFPQERFCINFFFLKNIQMLKKNQCILNGICISLTYCIHTFHPYVDYLYLAHIGEYICAEYISKQNMYEILLCIIFLNY